MFGELQTVPEGKMPQRDAAGHIVRATLGRVLLYLKLLKKELKFSAVCDYTNYQHHYRQGKSFKF